MKKLHVKIYGRVQGVGFRYSAEREAHKLGIGGFARNETDGSVYVVAQGEESALETFLAWCHKGPWFAKVDRVEMTEAAADEEFKDFKVR